jgi:uncharacterized protein (TIGR02598 family)
LAGFSLVEVTIALGIVAFAFVPLMGLLPVGLTSFRSAIDQTVLSQIVQQIGNESQQSDFDAVTTPQNFRFFDEQARELDATRSSEAIFRSRLVVVDDADSPHLKRLVIQVARNPGGAAELKETSTPSIGTLWSDDNQLPVATRSLLLARSSSIPPTP